ncbi:unnamed protein product [Cylicocyclus nassatus]|uniref:Amine oxidase domain-containing protein n=1 Tax=Cylicocyclus nassatus TaxID=53992 RepID=A0AA36DN29_CYLNA|nr:unnamed protein product [Cylicocyclus nassatus]
MWVLLPCPTIKQRYISTVKVCKLLTKPYKTTEMGDGAGGKVPRRSVEMSSLSRPVIEMTIPSVVDRSLVPDDRSHVMSLFTQYTPYTLKDGPWSDERKEQYAKHVFNEIDKYAPNFSSSIIGYEVLSPPDIEKVFGLIGGNVFHGSMSLDQLYFTRPVSRYSNYTTPIKGLYLCGSGPHPGGGVTGAPGRLAALVALQQ